MTTTRATAPVINPLVYAAFGVLIMAFGGTILVHVGEAPEVNMFFAIAFLGAGLYLLVAGAVARGMALARQHS